MLNPTWWAFIGLVLFLGLLAYLGVFGKIGALLDSRATKISRELDEARRLREEAQALLAEYQKKRLAAEREASDIVADAKAEAERMTADAEAALKDMIDRRTRSVEIKIAQAEKLAVAEVRAIAAEVAVEAASRILSERVTGATAADLIAKGIADAKARLN